MSIHDDATDGSGTMVYADLWCAADPNAWRWVAGPIFRESGAVFLECEGCLGYGGFSGHVEGLSVDWVAIRDSNGCARVATDNDGGGCLNITMYDENSCGEDDE